jgi:DNA-binding MarR family transcriptional regulator
MLKDVPRFECLLKAAERYPTLSPSAASAFLNLLRTGDAVFEAEGAHLARHDISQGRFKVLMLLNRCSDEPSTPAELADEAGVTRATMTGLVDTLVKDGLATRTDDPRDRRAVLVQLTSAGRELLERVLPGYFAAVTKIMHPLDETERTQLVALLQKIQQGLVAEPAPPALATAAL